MSGKLKQLYKNYFFFFPLLIALLLPFGINYGIFMIVWFICFFAFGDVKSGMQKVLTNKWFYVFFVFFLWHAIGYFFSVNKEEAISGIEIKLPFLFFPLLIFSHHFNNLDIRKIVISFVSGCFIASSFCLFRAFYLFYSEHINSFFYSDFTYFLHPSYFAMYLIFAQLIVILYYKKWLAHLKNLNFKIGFISIIFVSCIFLASSKMGLIVGLIVLPSALFVILYQMGQKKIIASVIFILILVVSLSYKLFPTPFERFKKAFEVTTSSQTIDLTDAESTAVRILIWKESIEIVKDHFLVGTTVGDAKDALFQSYQKKGITGAIAKKLNAHNQYLQTFIGTGLFGFILLVLMTVGIIIYGFLKKNFLLSLFGIVLTLNFLVESMLQAQAGFIFFTFFICLLLDNNLNKTTNHLNFYR